VAAPSTPSASPPATASATAAADEPEPVASAQRPVVQKPAFHPPAAAQHGPWPAPPAAPPAPHPAAGGGCSPPYTYDAQGLKHFKPECL
jgi:serine/threonine-protein kinase